MNELIELLPLPEKSEIDRHLPTGVRVYGYTADDMKTYARACVAHATTAQAAYRKSMDVEVLHAWAQDVVHALTQKPAAVDESFVERFCGRWFQLTGRSLDRPRVRACLTEALAGQPGGSDNDH